MISKQASDRTNGRKLRKTVIAAALIAAAIAALLLARQLGNGSGGIAILMYHNLVNEGEALNSMTITSTKFEEDLKYLRDKGYSSVLPRELLEPGFILPDKPVIISFDDGYRSNYEIAYPLLAKYGFKAEIAVISSCIDEAREFFCTWDMLREMHASGLIEIGSHTHDLHNRSTGGALSKDGINGVQRKKGESDAEFEERVLKDIKLGFERITSELGEAPVTFAYPYGSNDKDADKLIEQLFSFSFNTTRGRYYPGKGNYKLPRYEIYQDTELDEFL